MNATDFPHCGPLAQAEAEPCPHAVPPPWDIGRPQPAFAALARAGACGWLAALTRTCEDAPC